MSLQARIRDSVQTELDLHTPDNMVYHSIMSGGISLPKYTRTSTVDLITVLVLHELVTNIGDEHRCGLLIRLHRCAGYDPRFVRGDPSPS